MTKVEEIKYNWKNINSLFILKDIFSFLNKKLKLIVIIYNKELQATFGIDIKDYKISGRYKIAPKNGKGSEYMIDTDILVFEGEYFNGQRNGKGKEYYNNGNIEFEGEYLNLKSF